MGTIIKKNVVKREPGFLYYIDKDGNACKSALKRGRNKNAKNKVSKPSKKK